ncbi:MAG: hypothetical protein ACTSVV_14615 [Promethearchaeota archaeon]
MPYAIIFIKPNENISEDKHKEEILNSFSKLIKECLEDINKNILITFGTTIDLILWSFGYPDYVLCLWGPNVENLKSAILKIRQICKDLFTTTIIGVPVIEIGDDINPAVKLTQKDFFQYFERIQNDGDILLDNKERNLNLLTILEYLKKRKLFYENRIKEIESFLNLT